MDVLTANEISRRYNGTFAFVSYDGKEFGVKFRDFRIDDHDGGSFTAVVDAIYDRKSGKTSAMVLDMDKMNIHRIQHNSLFSNGKSLCLYSRRPLRQWRKGYYQENTILYDVVVNDMVSKGVNITKDPYSNIDIPSVEAFHNPDFANFFEDGINRIETEGRIGIAVNSSFGIGKSFIDGIDYILYFMNTPIAHISGNKVITLALTQEVRDFFKYYSRGGFDVQG